MSWIILRLAYLLSTSADPENDGPEVVRPFVENDLYARVLPQEDREDIIFMLERWSFLEIYCMLSD